MSSGDSVADKAGRERFLSLYDEKNVIEATGAGKAILSIGKEDYPTPISLVKKGKVWFFDAMAGKQD